jgi:hypothetical protein
VDKDDFMRLKIQMVSLGAFIIVVSLALSFGTGVVQASRKGDGAKGEAKSEKNTPDRAAAYYHFSLARSMEEGGNFISAVDEYK